MTLRGSKESATLGAVAIASPAVLLILRPLEHEPNGLADAAPFDVDAVGVDLDLGIGHVEVFRDPRLEKVEIDRPGHQAKCRDGDKHPHADDETGGDTQSDAIGSLDQRSILPAS